MKHSFHVVFPELAKRYLIKQCGIELILYNDTLWIFLNNSCYTISHYKNDCLLPLVNYQLHRRGDEEMEGGGCGGKDINFSVLNCEPTGHLSPL